MKTILATACIVAASNAYIVPAETQVDLSSQSTDAELQLTEILSALSIDEETMSLNGLNVKFVPKFIAGFFKGFTGANHLNELTTCMTDLETIH